MLQHFEIDTATYCHRADAIGTSLWLEECIGTLMVPDIREDTTDGELAEIGERIIAIAEQDCGVVLNRDAAIAWLRGYREGLRDER